MGARTRIIGLTGSIGMGKSTAAAMLSRMKIPVFSADTHVHRLMESDGAAYAAVTAAFPGIVEDGRISRPRLAAKVLGNETGLRRLESILHPLVRAAEIRFILRQNIARRPLAALEVPLLFETGAEELCDIVVVLSAPRFVQDARVLARPGMTCGKLAAIRARQMPEQEKRRRADVVIPTGLGRRRTLRELSAVVRQLKPERGSTGGRIA